MCEILRFCDFFVVLSCPVLVILFSFSDSRPARTPRPISTGYGLYAMTSPEDVLFGGFDDNPQFYGVLTTQKGGVVKS